MIASCAFIHFLWQILYSICGFRLSFEFWLQCWIIVNEYCYRHLKALHIHAICFTSIHYLPVANSYTLSCFHSCLKFNFFLNHYVMQCFPLHLENMLILSSSYTGMVAALTNESATSKAVYFAEELKNWQAHFWLIRMLHCWREEMRGMVNGLQRGKLGQTWGTTYREKEWYRSKFNFELRQIFSFSLLFIARIYVS